MPLFAGTELTDDNGAPAEKELEKVSGLNNSSKEDSSGYEGIFNSSGTEDSQQDQPAEQDGLHLYDQIKLSKLSVYNWGSFNGGHTINIDGVGTLITGENGYIQPYLQRNIAKIMKNLEMTTLWLQQYYKLYTNRIHSVSIF